MQHFDSITPFLLLNLKSISKLNKAMASRLICRVFSASYIFCEYCMHVFHSSLLYSVSAVLTDGHSTGQASNGFKIRNVKQDCLFCLFLRKAAFCTY